MVEFIVEATVHGKGNLEDFESVRIHMFERVLLLVLDRFPEGADVLGTQNLDREDMTGVIAEHEAIEIECGRHTTSRVQNSRSGE